MTAEVKKRRFAEGIVVSSPIDLNISGAIFSAKSANYTVLDGDNIRTIGMTCGASNRTVTLPTAADNNSRIITCKKIDLNVAGNLILDGEGAETIDGDLTRTLETGNQELTVQSDGSDWIVIGEFTPLTQYLDSSVSGGVVGLTSFPPGAVVKRGVFVPYQTVDGAWRLRFNMGFTMTPTQTGDFTITGIVTKNISGFIQGVAVAGSADNTNGRASISENNNTFGVGFENSSTHVRCSGDIELDSKPDWAD